MPRRVGVRLADLTDGAARLRHVHLEHDGWVITSASPVDGNWLDSDDAVLDRVLPGALGCYVYPADAVFCVAAKTATRTADLQELMTRYDAARDAPRGLRLNHMSVHAPIGLGDADDAHPPSDDEGAADLLEDDDEEEGEEIDEERDGDHDDDAAASDDDAAALDGVDEAA